MAEHTVEPWTEWAQHYTNLQNRLSEAERLLRAFTDYHREACHFDHHGYCQEHFLEATPGQCTVAVAKAFLDA